jgi:hypothetical protein
MCVVYMKMDIYNLYTRQSCLRFGDASVKLEASALPHLRVIQFHRMHPSMFTRRCPQCVIKLAARSEHLHSEDQPQQEDYAFDKCLANKWRSPKAVHALSHQVL